MSRSDLPVVDPAEFPDRRDRPDAAVHGVVLAAGTSSRYGPENKLLERLDGRPLVRLAVESLLDGDVDGVTVIVGHESDRVADAVVDLDVDVLENAAYADGQSTSVREGVRDAEERDADAVLIALGDMPRVRPSTIDLLVEGYRRGVGDAVAAAFEGRRGNPVLFDARFFDSLTDVDGDVGGRHVLAESEGATAVETGDPGVLRDVDRPSDLGEIG